MNSLKYNPGTNYSPVRYDAHAKVIGASPLVASTVRMVRKVTSCYIHISYKVIGYLLLKIYTKLMRKHNQCVYYVNCPLCWVCPNKHCVRSSDNVSDYCKYCTISINSYKGVRNYGFIHLPNQGGPCDLGADFDPKFPYQGSFWPNAFAQKAWDMGHV